MIDYWMSQPSIEAWINFGAVLELAAQAALLIIWGNRAPLNEGD